MRKVGKLGKSNEKIVMNEELVQNGVMNEELFQNSVMNEELVQNGMMDEELVQKSVMNEEMVQNGMVGEELVQKSVMNEEMVQNGMMGEKIVKNFVMDANIDPKVEMDLSIFEIGGRNILQPINQNLLGEFIDENEPWWLIGIPSKDLFLRVQCMEQHFVRTDLNVNELMPVREGLHVMMQCDMRQHFAELCWLHPGGHASWREPRMKKFTRTCLQMECSEDAI